MSYELRIEEEDRLVSVTATCLLNNNIRRNILDDINAVFHEKNYAKALIDLREAVFDPAEPIVGAVDLTIHLNRIRMKFDSKLAFVYTDAEEHRKSFEIIANKFNYRVQYFKKLEDARSWLLGN
ncbi:MAG: hypothetical protein C0622_02155 [Desulfuromonas sp.]|nr:MAG: hypothetical protein C0622_02155 [Desulfuromonas sp.]